LNPAALARTDFGTPAPGLAPQKIAVGLALGLGLGV
jgi:hypothetical protein